MTKEKEEKRHLQSTMPATQAPHSLGLHARHAEEVFRVRQVVGQLRELGLQLGLTDAFRLVENLSHAGKCPSRHCRGVFPNSDGQ